MAGADFRLDSGQVSFRCSIYFGVSDAQVLGALRDDIEELVEQMVKLLDPYHPLARDLIVGF